MTEPSRFDKVADQLSQAWDMASTGKYSTWRNPVSMGTRLSHVGHRLTDALHCLFTGQTRIEAMHSAMAEDFEVVEEEINRREKDKHPPLPYKNNGP